MNEFKIKNGLIINNTQPISGITNDYSNPNDEYGIPTTNAIKQYIDSKSIVAADTTQVIFYSGNTLSGSTNFVYNQSGLTVSNSIVSPMGALSYNGAQCIKMINRTGSPSVKGLLVQKKDNLAFNSTVNSIKVLPDDSMLVGGQFTRYNNISSVGLIKLNSDGTINRLFNASNSVSVRNIELQPDGKFFICGSFSIVSGVTTYNNFLRLNSDFTADDSFVMNDGGFSYYVYDAALQPDGKVVVGGGFNVYGLITQNYISRLDSGGTIDSQFLSGTGFNSWVVKLKLQSDGKILCGGQFTQYDGNNVNRIVRLNPDGTIDTGFTIGTGFNNDVYAIEVQSTGEILVGGAFLNYSGITANHIIRLNSDGTIDNTFAPTVGFDGNVNYIKVQPSGKILVCGQFTQYDYNNCYGFVVLNSDGSIDNTFYNGFGVIGDSTITVGIQSNSNLLIGGQFSFYNSYPINNIVNVDSGGTLNTNFNKATTGFEYYKSDTYSLGPYIGICVEDGVNDGENTMIAIEGICDVKISMTSDPIDVGYILNTIASMYEGEASYNSTSGYVVFARALEKGNPGDTIKCLLFNKNYQ